MNNKCIFIKEDGQQCEGFAISGSEYCLSHDPYSKDIRTERAKSGGKSNSSQFVNDPLEPINLKSASDISKALEKTINEVRTGKISIKAANTLGYLLGIALKAYQVTELDTKLDSINKVLKVLVNKIY